ncbi:Exodeoxyribonuclease III [Alkalibacterium sp. AK22]|uniref:endonuclease/exonuclease/phosphatase family protein n=1 Tax=Alkalibacterium sp. AK22 TaxID=1229520 RepID=UPI00044C047A|nr:endonuclease/exonuclease/phosphatase family protein [Alkalibacterium sp. AK22]EXJ23957.1 Exodeoxyribonuclease III [Alkalibacterium sp. AK22]
MNVLTLNTHAWMEDDPLEKLDRLAERIAASAYDFICLQEVNQSLAADEAEDPFFITPEENRHTVAVKKDNYALLLIQKLREQGINYYWSWTANHIGYSMYDEGVALLSLQPFVAEGHLVSLSTDYEHHYTRKILKAKAERGGKLWTVLSVHYSWWQSEEGEALFQSEWDKTLDQIGTGEKDHLLIMGDFNNDPSAESEGYHYVRQTAPYLQDAFLVSEKQTGEATVEKEIDGWEGHKAHKRIDYVFAGQKLEIKSYRVVFDGISGPVISDHFGVEAVINEE